MKLLIIELCTDKGGNNECDFEGYRRVVYNPYPEEKQKVSYTFQQKEPQTIRSYRIGKWVEKLGTARYMEEGNEFHIAFNDEARSLINEANEMNC